MSIEVIFRYIMTETPLILAAFGSDVLFPRKTHCCKLTVLQIVL